MSTGSDNERTVHETDEMRITETTKKFFLYYKEFGDWRATIEKGFPNKETALKYFASEFEV